MLLSPLKKFIISGACFVMTWLNNNASVNRSKILRADCYMYLGGTSLQESHSQGTEIHEISWNKQRLLAPAGKEANCCFGTTGLAQSTFPRNQHIPAAGQFVFTTRVRNVKGTGARSPERPLAEPCTLASASEDAVRQADSGSATQTLWTSTGQRMQASLQPDDANMLLSVITA